ncbi:hypothetical protein HWV62_43222 [Athelia sp. TMB]|nr:hypothetical protein HWV62_43222 [Athelia sp. TMB]
MSAPNVNGPNEGIIGQVSNSVGNAVNYVSDTLQGTTAEAKKESGKEQAKGNVPGQSGLGDRLSGAADAVSGKVDESKYKTSADETFAEQSRIVDSLVQNHEKAISESELEY